MYGPRLRAAFAVFLIALAASLVAASPALDTLRGLSIDVLTALRWRIYGNSHPPENSAAVVVALDEETFRTPPFDGTPSVTWTREIGQVLSAIIDGGARVVGFDIVFPTSIEQSAVPFGDETLGARVRGFDRDYLRALALGARAGKVVLGQVQHQDRPLLPSPGQRAAVGFGRNIRALNVHTDPDDVIRRVPMSFEVDGEKVPSMAAELVARGIEPMSDVVFPRLCRTKRRICSSSTFKAAPTTSRRIRLPTCTPARRKTTRISSSAISAARSY
jgi:CHASE2 domain-containing sensor protein